MKQFNKDDVLAAAVRLTQGGRLGDATAVLQRMLGGSRRPTLDGIIDLVDAIRPASRTTPPHRAPQTDGAGQFLAKTFSNSAGSRPYKLYVPSNYRDAPCPLIVMLHGCSQSPDDFAAGTQMNRAAEKHRCLVAYPGQIRQANTQKCWNWFAHSEQRRDGGEPSLIAGITQTVMRDFAIDPARVFIAGLSAGGAAAAIMGNTYPDLYAAIGVHSGLACGAARDMQSAFAVMQQGGDGTKTSASQPIVPAIVFHGERDTTVNPRNGDAIVSQIVNGRQVQPQVEVGQTAGGYTYRKTLYRDMAGLTLVEQWVVQGAGHAWFGGSQAGSYTDPRGPDATSEMVRFFLENAR